MEQQFQLKNYGKLSLFEQNQMPAEERAWWMRRLDREFKERKEREEAQSRSIPRPSTPSKPNISMPSMRR
jgi:hypothetical protein